jgi:UDP-N-acetylglucosamine:LPS N-acetylglucosamine transferase
MQGNSSIRDNELSGESLSRTIRALCENEALRAEMQKNSRALGKPEACAKVVDIAMSLVKNSVN